ncbi:MFS transporter [Sphingomonas sp.]|uniref:MFS transporter n=1 Tax=Sphingomonas sp. TaxID=28214 RepID=UPI003CC5EB16
MTAAAASSVEGNAAVAGSAPQELREREAAYHAFVAANLRRNFTGHFVHGMLGMTGFRLIYAPTFIPSYIHRLTGSDALVGLGTALLQLGAIISPIFSATRFEHQPRILPYAIRTGMAMRLSILGLALAGWFLTGRTLLVATLACLFLLGAFNGTQRVAFQMLMAKVIPLQRRGRLQAYRNTVGGAIAALLSYAAGRYLIERDVGGNGYATTIFLAFVLTSLGLTALRLFMVEPDPVSVRPAASFGERLRDFPRLLADRDYRWFVIAEALCVAARIASPFYILYAGQQLGLSGRVIGELSLCYLGADTASNLLWGNLGDRTGYRLTLMASTVLWGAAIALLLAVHQPWAVFVAFCGLGAGALGYQMSQQTMVLEFGERTDVAMRLALSTTIEGTISAIGPLIGGLVATTLGYRPLMGAAGAFLLASFVLILTRVHEPRRKVRPVVATDLGEPEEVSVG